MGLGKGLDALLQPEEEFVPPSPGGESAIPLDKLRPNPEQPRKYFGEDELRELADSIREHGIIEPIIAEESGDGFYTIIAGERRYRAALLAGLQEAPVLLRSYPPEARLEIALIENIQRTDLNPIEEAEAYKKLMELTGLSQDSVAAKVGKNRSTVANALRLLRLPAEIQESLIGGEMSPGHGRAILQAARAEDRETLFREIRKEGLSVREAERRAALLNGGPAGIPGAPEESSGKAEEAPPRRIAELADMEEKLIEKFGTKVSVQGSLEKGHIRIDYYSRDDLDRLYGIMLEN
ncbi:MAG: ParB/RepB/Spo0J family partition protein [Treponema sp.]|jgi:ParB family chromosome partitioning protein|nr:ParB/RepB/Spo0J family partition protein [Treponema sp.]